MMKKQLIIGAMLVLSGCAQVDDFTSVVKHPARKG
jgi:PBP1b-binding outer membrane lipoprotein LpoB